MNINEISVGTIVNVEPTEGDLFDTFTGRVTEKIDDHNILVEDQEGDIWTCYDFQLSRANVDEILHGA